MKIGIDISQIVYSGTGVATYTKNLVEKLLEIDKKNEYVLFGSSLRRRQKGFWPFPPTFLDLLWNQLHILPVENLIGKIDVFHSSDWTQPPTKAKKVTTIHDMVVYKFPHASHKNIVSVQKRRLGWVKKECDVVIAVSESTKKDIVEILGIKEEKIKVVYEAARSFFKKSPKKYVGKPYILAVGTREPRKNLDRLVKAFKSLNLKDVDLLIAGKHGWGKDIQGVKTLDYISPEGLVEFYSGAACFVYPSIYEGFGIPILEAFSCGCPVVTSNISSMPEVGGRAAIYADPLSISDIAEKIKYVLDLSSSKRKELTERGISQAEKFSWEKAAKETIKIYEEVA